MLIRKRNGLIVKQGGLLARNCRQLVTPSGCSACVAAGLAPAGYSVTFSGVKPLSDHCGIPHIATQNDPPAPTIVQADDDYFDQLGAQRLSDGAWQFQRNAAAYWYVGGVPYCRYDRLTASRTAYQCKDISSRGYNPGTQAEIFARVWATLSIYASGANDPPLFAGYPQYRLFLAVCGIAIAPKSWDCYGGANFPAGGDPANDAYGGNLYEGFFPIDTCGRLIAWTSDDNHLTIANPLGNSPPYCLCLGTATVAMT